ncbi:MAG: NAD-binding protein [Pseudonocardia sp.]
MGGGGSTPLRLWAVTGVVSVVAVVLGFVGFGPYLRARPEYAGAGFADRLYYTVQLFLLDPTPLDGPPYEFPLNVALFLAPLATVLAVLTAVAGVFRARLAAWALRRRTGHAVVVGAGPEAFVLAQRLAAGGPTVLVGSGVRRDVARRHGLRVVDGDVVDVTTLAAAGVPGAARVFAMAETGAVNAGVALLVRSLRRGPVSVYARADDGELVAALRAQRLGAEADRGFRLDFFSVEQVAAGVLLDEHDDPVRPATVIGENRFADAVARELRHRRDHAGSPASVTVVPDRAPSTVEHAGGTAYVCSGDPDEVLRSGLQLLLAGHHRVVACVGRRSALADALEQRLFSDVGGRLAVFGVLDAACDPGLLERGATVERLARALHARYLAAYADGTQASHVPWRALDEPFRADNREQAEHIGTKLATVDAVIVPAAPGLPGFAMTDGEVERLAEMEHERWMAVKRRAGVRHGAERTPTTHPDMIGWDDGLTETAKEKDRMFVRGVPALLAAEGLAIVRLPPARA